MKNFLLAIYFLAEIYSATANNLLLQKLTSVNNEWTQQTDIKDIISNVNFATIHSKNDWIALHLNLVETTLRNRNVSHLSTVQQQNRLYLLNYLHQYWQAKTFPINDYKNYTTPVFIDRKGTHCAVGYLMQQSGHEALAKAIDNTQKFAYVHDINIEGVQTWANTYGFSIDELAWIQPGYPPTADAKDMKKGFDGPVNAMVVEPINGTIYAAGSFSKATEGMNCNNIAAWITGIAGFDWIALDNGVNGTVHALLIHNNKLYVGGEFTEADNIAANRVAVFDLSTNQWEAMGSLDNTVRAFAVYNNEIYAGGDFSGLVSKWNGTSWQTINNGLIAGQSVKALQVYNSNLVIGGNFDLLTGAERKHVAQYNGTDMLIMGMGTLTPVNDFEIHESKLYAACNFVSDNDTCALAVFDDVNENWLVELKPNSTMPTVSYLYGNAFNSLLSNENDLLIGGDFFSNFGMKEGNNLASYKKVSYPNDTVLYSVLDPYLTLDSTINCLATYGSDIYFGGNFSTNAFVDTLNHIGYINMLTVDVKDISKKKNTVQVYPNPCVDFINITSNSSTEKVKSYEVYDALGHYVLGNTINTYANFINVKYLSKGVYTVKITTSNNSIEILKIVKQ